MNEPENTFLENDFYHTFTTFGFSDISSWLSTLFLTRNRIFKKKQTSAARGDKIEKAYLREVTTHSSYLSIFLQLFPSLFFLCVCVCVCVCVCGPISERRVRLSCRLATLRLKPFLVFEVFVTALPFVAHRDGLLAICARGASWQSSRETHWKDKETTKEEQCFFSFCYAHMLIVVKLFKLFNDD